MHTLDDLPLPQRDLYLEGYRAFQTRKRLEDNPYARNTYFAVMWDHGWADADDDVRLD
jgi:hypothetical protein